MIRACPPHYRRPHIIDTGLYLELSHPGFLSNFLECILTTTSQFVLHALLALSTLLCFSNYKRNSLQTHTHVKTCSTFNTLAVVVGLSCSVLTEHRIRLEIEHLRTPEWP